MHIIDSTSVLMTINLLPTCTYHAKLYAMWYPTVYISVIFPVGGLPIIIQI